MKNAKLTSDFSTTDYIQLEQNQLIFFFMLVIDVIVNESSMSMLI